MLSIMMTALVVSTHVITAAYNGIPIQNELVQMAVMLPQEDICNKYLDGGKVEDYNGDCQEIDSEDESVRYGIYREIQEEILNWQ